MAGVEARDFDSPDETRTPDKSKVDVVRMGGSSAARLTLHLELQAGTNAHHMIEACFKAFARALRAAVAVDPSEPGIPSTKDTLT